MSGIIYPSFYDKSAGKMPYVYHDKPIPQYERIIRYHSPFLGIKKKIIYSPREEYGRNFDNVRGIKIDNFIVLREMFFHNTLPGDIREISKQFPGRLPSEEEIRQIFIYRSSICNNLLELGEQPLLTRPYLFHKGDGRDEDFNYCLNFSTGETTIADCDDSVSALLVA